MIDGFYTYVLECLQDGKKYTGYTENIEVRFEQHQRGEVQSTKSRRPFKLIYYEWCLNQKDALQREKYLKTTYGKMAIKKRLKSYYSET